MEAIFSGLSALVEGAIELTKLFFSGFINLVRAAFDHKLDHHERGRVAVVACLQIAASVLVVIGVWSLFVWFDSQAGKTSRMRLETDKTVHRMADQLDAQIGPDGRYVHARNRLTEVDAWGQPLLVNYQEEKWGESLEVKSSGPDQRFGTDDDILAVRKNFRAKDVAKDVGGQVGKFVMDKIKKRKPEDENAE